MDMGALPFCHFEKTSKKPLSRTFPKKLASLGDHVRLKRLTLNMTQKEAAGVMGVDEMTIVGWELNDCKPHIYHIPSVIRYLGYVPEDLFPSATTGQKIKRYRMLNGLTRKALANRLHIDDATLRRIETGKGKIFQKTEAKVSRFIDSLG